MKRLLLYTIVLLISYRCHAQSYMTFPDSIGVWKEQGGSGDGFWCQGNTDAYQFVGKTVIDSLEYRLLQKRYEYEDGDCWTMTTYGPFTRLIGGIREDSSKHVYFYNYHG